MELLQLIGVRFKEFIREPGVIFWSILFPILMAWGLGSAFTKKGELVQQVAILENTNSQNEDWRDFISRGKKIINQEKENTLNYEVTTGSKKLGKTRYKFIPSTNDEAITLLKKGVISLIIIEEKDSMVYYFDPLNPEAKLNYMIISNEVNSKGAKKDRSTINVLDQVGTRYIDFLIPGLIAMGVMMSIMWGVSYSLIDKRSKKLLRRLVATPMKKSNFLGSHFITRSTLSFIESSLLFLFSFLYFGTIIQGNAFAAIVILFSGIIGFTGIAILVSSRTDNTQIGNGLINAIVMPMMILSGIFFNYHNFPEWMIGIIQKMPLTMLADSLRSIFIEGTGFKENYSNIITLLVYGFTSFFLGLKMFRWY